MNRRCHTRHTVEHRLIARAAPIPNPTSAKLCTAIAWNGVK